MIKDALEKIKGLSKSEVAELQRVHGFNELPSSGPKSIWRIVLDVIKEPMFILLVACGGIYMLIGDRGEGFMLLSSVFIIIGITFYQEKRTERALDVLKELSSPRALVIRDGEEERIAGREIVVGDIIILQEGDRVPADAFIIEALSLKADESLLTGESVSLRKGKWDGQENFSLISGEDTPFVYSGTLIVHGHGIARVAATGTNTQLGKIGKALGKIKEEPTLLRKETANIVKIFSIIGFSLCVVLILVYGFTKHDWLAAILSGLSLAMSMLPEEFVVVLTIFMAIGAWRISKKNVLARKAASIETLGSVTVLCTDKTGTLTENRMTVRKLFTNENKNVATDEVAVKDEKFHELIRYSILSSQLNPFDPMEKAIHLVGKNAGLESENLHDGLKMLKEYPLTSGLFVMSHVFEMPGKQQKIVAAKGSPEAIIEICRLNKEESKLIEKQISAFASEGLRVLGVACAEWTNDELPDEQKDFEFRFCGLIGMEDPLRPSIIEDLKSCYNAGIRVIMITGDNPVTAQHIARKMGLNNCDEVLTGKELSEMNVLQLREKIKTVNIFARVVPEQKLILVEELKNCGEVVAMTGDGVNDAPALRAAHIGIAMGKRGTDVAREAAGIVLLDDNFSSVVAAVRMGRRIYDNIQKAMAYIFSVHLPIAGLTLIPILDPVIPILLFPLHIAFLELIIDPASTLIFENEEEEKNIMMRKPRDINQPVFGAKRIFLSMLEGFFVMVVCLVVAWISTRINRPENEVRALTFATLIIANIGLILVNRSETRTILETFREKNSAVKWVVGGAVVFLGFVLYTPVLRNLFHFDFLHFDDILICTLAGISSILWFELMKRLKRRRKMNAQLLN